MVQQFQHGYAATACRMLVGSTYKGLAVPLSPDKSGHRALLPMFAKPDKLQDLQVLFESATQALIRFTAQRYKETVDNLAI